MNRTIKFRGKDTFKPYCLPAKVVRRHYAGRRRNMAMRRLIAQEAVEIADAVLSQMAKTALEKGGQV